MEVLHKTLVFNYKYCFPVGFRHNSNHELRK
jgi:hypothetical protein